jgi:hypothetical protein
VNVDFPPLHPVHGADYIEKGEEPAPVHEHETSPVPGPNPRTAADIRLEDLFEDVEPPKSPAGRQEVLPVPDETAGAPPGIFAEEDADSEEKSGPEEDEINQKPDDSAPGSFSHIEAPRAFNRQQWFDLFTWARHADALTADQRREIIRMGRLIQKGRKLTQQQDARIREMIELAQSLGYQIR